MPVITVDYKDLINLLGKHIDMSILLDRLPMIGVSIERVENEEISIEVFPNRPDMLSVEGVARALRNFLGIEEGLKIYPISPPKISLYVKDNIEKIRPYIGSAVIKNVKMTHETIKSIMDCKKKLQLSIGKDRKKMAIGVHDFDKVEPPFYYKAVEPKEIKFVPLGKEEEMNLIEILNKHEKGIAYRHLLEKYTEYPIILDKNGNVLSFPPIINGELTAVNQYTKNIFIEVTGIDKNAVLSALVIISSFLAERGGQIEQVEIIGKEKLITPDFSPKITEVETDYIKKLLKINNTEEIVKSLKRMGHNVELFNDKLKVYSPAWRIDILHPIDIVEDVAIGYGYEKFEEMLPISMTFGSSFSFQKLHETMIGLGFYEVITLSLSNPDKEFKKFEMEGNPVEIKNPISTEHSIVRQSLLPSLLEILNKNRHNELPQQIYEIGNIVYFDGGKAKQKIMIGGVKIDAKTGFTECKSIVEAILRNFGLQLNVKECKHKAFIEGRCAAIIVDKDEIGYFGELKPSVICNFELEYPVIAFEIDVNKLFSFSQQKQSNQQEQ